MSRSSSSRKIKLSNIDEYAIVDAEDYDIINQFEWFGVINDETGKIHAARAIEIGKDKFELELMENFVVFRLPQIRRKKRQQTRKNHKKNVNK